MKFLSIALTSALISSAYSQKIVSHCVQGGICYKVNVPEQSASSGSGSIFFQIQGPSGFQYIALGQGSQMAGANIFIIYADSTGNNVTLSPRLGKGEFEPDADDSGQATLLAGSGISNGKMTANVRCSKCTSWQGGKMDITASDSQWIWSVKSGSAIQSNSVSARLSQHEGQGSFKLDLTQARGGDSANPFVGSGAATATVASTGSAPSSGSSSGGYGGSSGGAGDYAQIAKNFAKRDRSVIAHGIIMGLTFAIIFPLGSILIRLLSFSGLVWVHAGVQMLAYLLALVGMALGIYIAVWPSEVHLINNSHPVIGLVVICLLVFQPILGMLHHRIYAKTHTRTPWATAHVWYGRVLITLGIINGGLGLRLSGNTKSGEIAYGVIAGFMWIVWMSIATASYWRWSSQRRGETGEKLTGGYSRDNGYGSGSLQEENGRGIEQEELRGIARR